MSRKSIKNKRRSKRQNKNMSRNNNKNKQTALMDINKRDSNGWTALMHACNNGQFDIIYELLKNKDIDVEIENEWTYGDQRKTALTILFDYCNEHDTENLSNKLFKPEKDSIGPLKGEMSGETKNFITFLDDIKSGYCFADGFNLHFDKDKREGFLNILKKFKQSRIISINKNVIIINNKKFYTIKGPVTIMDILTLSSDFVTRNDLYRSITSVKFIAENDEYLIINVEVDNFSS